MLGRLAPPSRRGAPRAPRRPRRLPGGQRHGPAAARPVGQPARRPPLRGRWRRRRPRGPRPPHRRARHAHPRHDDRPARLGGRRAVEQRSFAARFDFGARPDLLASFPFPHELRIDVAVDAATLTVATTVVATGRPGRPGRRSATTRTSASPAAAGTTSVSACRPAGTSSSTTRGLPTGAIPRRGGRGRAARAHALRRPLRARRRSAARARRRRAPPRPRARGGVPVSPRCSPRRQPTTSASSR